MISAGFTALYKFVAPVAYVLLVAYLIWCAVEMDWSYVPGWLWVTPWLFIVPYYGWLSWISAQVKWVEMDAENFYVSNYWDEIVIPRSDLFEATGLNWSEAFYITLHLRRPSKFGERIIFIPPFRFAPFWRPNTIIEELNARD